MTANYIVGVLLVVVFSYLLGSLNFAIILSNRLNKEDIRSQGSGNAGMTNMLRVYGKKIAIFTALGDFLKGLVAVLFSRYIIFPYLGITIFDPGYIAGLAVLLGHMFPVYFGFKGGKGVMTSIGVLFVIDPLVTTILLVLGLAGIFITGMVSVGSIFGAFFFPVFTLISRLVQGKPVLYDTFFALIIGGLVVFMHRSNIQRILKGNENSFRTKKTDKEL